MRIGNKVFIQAYLLTQWTTYSCRKSSEKQQCNAYTHIQYNANPPTFEMITKKLVLFERASNFYYSDLKPQLDLSVVSYQSARSTFHAGMAT